MRAAFALGEGRVEIREVPVPEPGEDELVVRTHYAAICGSDLHHVFGAAPQRPAGFGHESVGTVVRSNSPQHPENQLVLVVPPAAASHAFAEYQVVSVKSVVPLADGTDPRRMVLAQQLGTVIYAMKKFLPSPPVREAAVIGCGPAGLNFVQLLRRRGVEQIIASDLRPWRAELAARLGATSAVVAGDGNIVDEVLTRSRGMGVRLAIDASGRNAGRRQAMLSVTAGGRVGFYGLPEAGEPDTSMPYAQIFAKAPDLLIANAAQYEPGLASFREAVRLIDEHEVEPDNLISHEFPFEGLEEACRMAHDLTDGVVKAMIKID